MTAENTIMSDQSGIHVIGDENTLEHRIFLKDGGRILSPFHDVPLFANSDHTVLNMVVEIPRWTNAKFEISRTEAFNPIEQDEQKGRPRYVRSCFPYKGYIWNYGALPQTWEDPSVIHPDIGFPGDNDPLDACEIGTAVAKRGEIKQVKVLGVICLIDSGETDWKTIVIDIKDPMAAKLHGIQDVYEHMPGLLEATKDWFRIYKIPQGKPPNSFALNGIFQDKLYADHVIQECSDAWKRLITGKTPCGEINLLNSTVCESPHHIGGSEFQPPEQTSSRPFDTPADDWVFIDRENLSSS